MEVNHANEKVKKTRRAKCLSWLGSPSFYLMVNFLLSQWGDWMWQFSVGIYLVHLSGNKLRLAAIFGLTGGVCVLLFGGIIGEWVDRNGRMKVVRVSLFIQNLSVALSAVFVCVVLALEPSVDGLKDGTFGRYLMEAAVITLAVVAQLASVAYKIAIEKDWIVVIAAGKSSLLTNLNAITRSLDLACKIVSPLTVGLIMSYFSLLVSAIVLAAWNVISVFVEYAILFHIYKTLPQLAIKGGVKEDTNDPVPNSPVKSDTVNMNVPVSNEDEEIKKPFMSTDDEKGNDVTEQNGISQKNVVDLVEINPETKEKSCLAKMFEPFVILFSGWKVYARQSVLFAGISLACLYMTVMGFDSITVGYIYANNVSEALVGLCMGLAGITGILGAFTFTYMAKRFGLETTGVFAYTAEVMCLILAVASIWAPGTRFNPSLVFTDQNSSISTEPFYNQSNVLGNLDVIPGLDGGLEGPSPIGLRTFDSFNSSSSTASHVRSLNSSSDLLLKLNASSTEKVDDSYRIDPSNVSMFLLLIGIVSSRVGLWMADLVVTQLLQENIQECERGVVNGVQNSLNMFMDMTKFILVMLLPQIEIFGLHILLSFVFIVAGMLCFYYYAFKAKRSGHHKPEVI